MPDVPIEEQIRFAEGAAQRNREYWVREAQARKCGPAYAAQRAQVGDAVVETLRRVQRGEVKA